MKHLYLSLFGLLAMLFASTATAQTITVTAGTDSVTIDNPHWANGQPSVDVSVNGGVPVVGELIVIGDYIFVLVPAPISLTITIAPGRVADVNGTPGTWELTP